MRTTPRSGATHRGGLRDEAASPTSCRRPGKRLLTKRQARGGGLPLRRIVRHRNCYIMPDHPTALAARESSAAVSPIGEVSRDAACRASPQGRDVRRVPGRPSSVGLDEAAGRPWGASGPASFAAFTGGTGIRGLRSPGRESSPGRVGRPYSTSSCTTANSRGSRRRNDRPSRRRTPRQETREPSSWARMGVTDV
jgi:hypothetical protein